MSNKKLAKYAFFGYDGDKLNETNRYYENDDDFLSEYRNARWFKRLEDSEISFPDEEVKSEAKCTIIVDKIIKELNSRGGFDDWWGNIDEGTKEEILTELEQIVINNS